MSDCIFCKIIAREIPSASVYEDEEIYAFLDIHPTNRGHTLVVPKRHCSGLLDCAGSVLPPWILATQKIAQAVKNGMQADGLNLMQNEGAAAGQVVPHLHIHIVPRFAGDGFRHWPGKTYPTDEEMERTAEKIRGLLQRQSP